MGRQDVREKIGETRQKKKNWETRREKKKWGDETQDKQKIGRQDARPK